MIQNSGSTSLPTTALSVDILPVLWEAPDNMISHGTNFSNWISSGSASLTSTGMIVPYNSLVYKSVTGLSSNSNYWCSMKVLGKSASAGYITVSGGNFSSGGLPCPIPSFTNGYYQYFSLSTDANSSPHQLNLYHLSSTAGQSITIEDFRIHEIPIRSSAKVAILGDREGGYNATYATAVDNAILSASADNVNVFAVGDQASTSQSHAALNTYLMTGLNAKTGTIYSTMGNHDYDGSQESSWFSFYTGISGLNSGKRYYKKSLGEMAFFVMDTCAPADNSGPAPEDNAGGRAASSATAFANSVMGQWLYSGLLNASEKWKIVIIHHPAYTSSSTGPFTSCRLPFDDWGAHVVIQSHDHGVERIFKDGIYYYTCAMGGGSHHGWTTALPETKFRIDSNITSSFATTYGYLKLHDSVSGLVMEYFNTGNKLLDRCKLAQIS